MHTQVYERYNTSDSVFHEHDDI